MVELPRRVRERCIGPDPLDSWETDEANVRMPRGRIEDAGEEMPGAGWESPAEDLQSEEQSDQDADQQRLRKRLKILNDPTFVRLNRLIVYLADEAAGVAPVPDVACTLDSVASQLRLWTAESAGGVEAAGQLMDALAGQRRRRQPARRMCGGGEPSLCLRHPFVPGPGGRLDFLGEAVHRQGHGTGRGVLRQCRLPAGGEHADVVVGRPGEARGRSAGRGDQGGGRHSVWPRCGIEPRPTSNSISIRRARTSWGRSRSFAVERISARRKGTRKSCSAV